MNKILKKSRFFLLITLFSALVPSATFAETYDTSNGSSTIHVETNGDSNIQVHQDSKTNSVNSVQSNSDESIHIQSNNGDTKSQVIINGKKVYEGNSGHIEVRSNSSTATKSGTTTNSSDSKTTVTTKDGKTTVVIEKNGDTSTIKNNDVSATTDMDVTLDKTNNTLKIKIGDKTQEIKLLPDEAVKMALDDKIIDSVNEKNKSVTITSDNNQIVYKIIGTKNLKIFGLLPVKYTRTAEISAKNGKVLTFESPFYIKILGLFSK